MLQKLIQVFCQGVGIGIAIVGRQRQAFRHDRIEAIRDRGVEAADRNLEEGPAIEHVS